ncbi:hypothetical protein ACFQZZ_08075 [Nocardia sp. GCM10030253]|uniref:hypothetical protein n=1 Tax=Nocardia sp. GCM10030253 TaxID=3273404 RepID=UPI00362E69BC
MPGTVLAPGQNANFGAGVLAGSLVVTTPTAGTFSVTLGGGAAVPHAPGVAGGVTVAVNGAAVTVLNTTPGVGSPAGDIVLNY